MSIHHELKIWPVYYKRVLDGSKTFEVRKNDRGFQMGDIVTLREYDYEQVLASHKYSGKQQTFKIGFVFPLDEDRVVFSLLPLEHS